MPQALGAMATALWKEVIYVAGGYLPGLGVVDTLYAYNIKSDTWATLAPMPQALNNLPDSESSTGNYTLRAAQGTGL